MFFYYVYIFKIDIRYILIENWNMFNNLNSINCETFYYGLFVFILRGKNT